jgi:hypothetical protein
MKKILAGAAIAVLSVFAFAVPSLRRYLKIERM